MNKDYQIPALPLDFDFETKNILRQLSKSNRRLAELKGVALTIPNENILLSSLVLQEALDSSAVENIVTTSDELYRAELDIKGEISNAAAKEVLNYRQAMQVGFEMVRKKKLLTLNVVKQIQKELEHNNAGFRTVSGTKLKTSKGDVVYTPPQTGEEVAKYMSNLEMYINTQELQDIDPLIKMAIIHHQFESIHPFYDGNGRTGRIISILYLVMNDLLDLPILYLSRYITHNKSEYYRLIQEIRDTAPDNFNVWEEWIVFMLKGVEETAIETIRLVKSISALMAKYKSILKPLFGKQYKHELINNLFFHPYTKIEFMERDMAVQRKTAAKYLDTIVQETGLLQKQKLGRSNYYINTELIELFMLRGGNDNDVENVIESVNA
ncbi:MAG: Fic family protein [Sodaliphilus sp.]|nr:Fic family protein [Bacteroidales bacterium]MDY3008803.1 Fic family protein [Sodaliphilus sp.]